jgi:NAD(P)-dependent dehydrogenase (short-subunit alcohol dehydrogenase family)
MSTSPVTIVTGASRGLGLAIAKQLLAEGHRLLTIQRTPNADLAKLADNSQAVLEQWSVDLTSPLEVAQQLQQWVAGLTRGSVSALNLINNAAMLVEPGPLASANLTAISHAMRAGLEAPVLLSAAFLGASNDLPPEVPRKILNISSGLGRQAMAGSAVYCATKAGMDHVSRSLALEAVQQSNGARIISLAPGVIDTDMQVQLRGADPSTFPDQHRFAGLKSKGLLDTPEAAAAKVVAYFERSDFGKTVIADVRDPN